MPENNGKQNPEELYTIKYQKHVACSYGYKLVCVDDKFSNSKPFKIYLGKDPVYNFINSMIEESKYCRLVNKNMEILKIILNVGSDSHYVDNDVKIRDHCPFTGRYRGSAHRDCNINLKS